MEKKVSAHILIVEDEQIVAADLEYTLQSLGYTVVGVAVSGEEALEKIQTRQPDLILMDIKLKGESDGITTAEQIRLQWRLPVVYMTAYADEETLDRARVTEPFGYLLKPFEEHQLRPTIEMALYKHRMETLLRLSRDELELRVRERTMALRERTAELLQANDALHAEIIKRTQTETELRDQAAQLTAAHEQLRQLTAQLYRVREEERIRLGERIQTELGQTLTEMDMRLAILTDQLPSEPPTLQKTSQELSSRLSALMGAVRKITSTLRPPPSNMLDLLAALRWQAQEFQARPGVTCQLLVPETTFPLTPDQGTTLFRICEEALGNVLNHAQVTTVTIRLALHNKHVQLEVHDNGIQIPSLEPEDPYAVGLLGIHERAARLGGQVVLENMSGQGVKLVARLPVHEA